MLEKCACQSNHDEDTCQDLVQDCFGRCSLLVIDYEQANTGLGSVNWCERLPCLLALWKLIKDWDGIKATPLLLQDHTSLTDYSKVDVLQLEDAITRFYTDSFFFFLVVLLSYLCICLSCLHSSYFVRYYFGLVNFPAHTMIPCQLKCLSINYVI